MSGKRAAAWLAGIVLLGLTGCAQPVPPAAVPSGTSHTTVPERTAALEQPSGADTTVSAEMPSTAATTTTTSATTTTTVPPPSTTAPSAVQPPDKNVRTAYLTFDDGPCHHTPELLQILEEYGVKATFYVVRPADDECRGYYR
ncbi:MAG: polysaccharide deacetylase family protein, partial [Clostridiales bacterium]|nr:polysaccharide deacetylase family protein [Clostridiales bacterium]